MQNLMAPNFATNGDASQARPDVGDHLGRNARLCGTTLHGQLLAKPCRPESPPLCQFRGHRSRSISLMWLGPGPAQGGAMPPQPGALALPGRLTSNGGTAELSNGAKAISHRNLYLISLASELLPQKTTVSPTNLLRARARPCVLSATRDSAPRGCGPQGWFGNCGNVRTPTCELGRVGLKCWQTIAATRPRAASQHPVAYDTFSPKAAWPPTSPSQTKASHLGGRFRLVSDSSKADLAFVGPQATIVQKKSVKLPRAFQENGGTRLAFAQQLLNTLDLVGLERGSSLLHPALYVLVWLAHAKNRLKRPMVSTPASGNNEKT